MTRNQVWSVNQHGPEGYVVGRIGVPTTWEGFEQVVNMLRRQIVANRLFYAVFDVSHVQSQPADPADVSMDERSSDSDTRIYITASLAEAGIRIDLPLVGSEPQTRLILNITVSDSGALEIAWSSPSREMLSDDQRRAVDEAVQHCNTGPLDLVVIADHIASSLDNM